MTSERKDGYWPGSELLNGDLGYYFSEPDDHHAPGGLHLVIQIHHHPTFHHFDPEQVRADIWSANGLPETLTFRHPWTFGEKYPGLPGRIHMIDRKGKEAHAFSFGGQWEIHDQDDLTRFQLDSTAPILDCNRSDARISLLADEVEVLMAEHRALRHSLQSTISPVRQLCDPLLVYAASLKELSEKYRHLEAGVSPTLLEFYRFLLGEIAILEERSQMPAKLPDMNCLF